MCLLISCSLEEEILDESTGTELLDEEGIELNIIAPAYGRLTTLLSCCDVFALNEVTTDEIIIPARGLNWFDNGIWIRLHEHSWTPEHNTILFSWNNLDNGASRANAALLLLTDNVENVDPVVLKSLQAELRFLRTLYRYYLLDFFRQVPMRDERDQNFNEIPPVFNAPEAFDWLVEELESIIPDLKDHGDVPYGRVTRQAAYGLLAKLYLNAEVYSGIPKWEETLEACDAIINSGFYEIADDYFQIFSYDNDNQNPEAIFVIRQSLESQNNVAFSASFTLHYSQNLGFQRFTFNGFSVVEDFFYKWDQDGNPDNGVSTVDFRFQDDRIRQATGANLGFLVGPQINPDSTPIEDPQRSGQMGSFVQLDYTPQISGLTFALDHEGVRVLKYNPDPEGNFIFIGRNDYLLLRYSDIWLMKAEALMRSGQSGAKDMVDLLREKRGVPPLEELTMEALLDERGFELYWEGHRRQDLVRFGQYTSGEWAHKEASADYRNVFPIPQLVLDVNSNLRQNPGY